VDVATDGFIIGAGFAAVGETGTVLALGLSVELLFLGLAVTSERIAGWRIVGVTAALGLTVLGFAVLGNLLLAGASAAVLAGTLSFSAAALLYLVTEELLMEAHEVGEKPVATPVLFGGFLPFWAIQLMGHRYSSRIEVVGRGMHPCPKTSVAAPAARSAGGEFVAAPDFDRHRRVPGFADGIANLLGGSFSRFHGHQVPGQVDRDLGGLVGVLHGLGDGAGAVAAGHVADLEGKHGALLGACEGIGLTESAHEHR
jgi:ZIP family zinc transporter